MIGQLDLDVVVERSETTGDKRLRSSSIKVRVTATSPDELFDFGFDVLLVGPARCSARPGTSDLDLDRVPVELGGIPPRELRRLLVARPASCQLNSSVSGQLESGGDSRSPP
jgi:hypothetical protein